jgi:hypothetical protein
MWQFLKMYFLCNEMIDTAFGGNSKWLAAIAPDKGRVFLVFDIQSRYAHAKSHPPMMKKGA